MRRKVIALLGISVYGCISSDLVYESSEGLSITLAVCFGILPLFWLACLLLWSTFPTKSVPTDIPYVEGILSLAFGKPKKKDGGDS